MNDYTMDWLVRRFPNQPVRWALMMTTAISRFEVPHEYATSRFRRLLRRHGRETEGLDEAGGEMIKVGQRWKENDGRFNRVVSIIEIDILKWKAAIRAIDPYSGMVGGRKTWASLDRFNGKSNGYTLVQEAK